MPLSKTLLTRTPGLSKIYHGGPIYLLKGFEVPCIRWTPKGSINGVILLEMLNALDILEVDSTEREQGSKPIFPVYVHGSRFDLKLIGVYQYSWDWMVRLYRRTIWYILVASWWLLTEKWVAYFGIISLKKKRKQMISPHIFPFEIIIIVNYVWSKSFNQIRKSKCQYMNEVSSLIIATYWCIHPFVLWWRISIAPRKHYRTL